MRLWNYIKEKMMSHPNQIVSENDAVMTYEELCIFVEMYAQKLKNGYYGILCQSEMATAMYLLACIAAEKTVIPFPVRYGKEICTKIWKRATPPYIITDYHSELEPIPCFQSGNLAYRDASAAVILFTSGSTGKPKGIMLSERNLLSNIQDITSYFPIGEQDTILISRSLYHSSVLTGEFLVSLCAGAKIVFSSESFQPQNILNLMKEKKITVLESTPTLLSTLSRFVRKTDDMTIRLLSVSGECMTEGMAKNIRRAFPCAEIYCGYGLSETSPRVAYLPAELFDQKPTCAGFPLASVKIRIVRENGRDAAKGEIGEVLVKGPNVMLGYFDDPTRTKAVVKNGWLHTGDLGLMDYDGMLTIKGRKDDMIIRAGMNIYPAEIENALSSDQRIGDIQAYGYEKNGTQEIGLIVSGEFSSVEEVMTLCRASLPSYQLPSKIELVEKTEILTGGKRRRKRL